MPKLVQQQDDVLTQGTTYEEDESTVDNTIDPIPPTDNDSGKRSTGVIIAIVVVVLVLIVAIVFAGMKIVPKVLGNNEEETEEFNEEWTEPIFEYMDIEIEELRLNGYTGDEIEQFQEESIPADIMIDEAKEKRQALYEEEIQPYLDGASEEFIELKNMTWVGGDEFSYNPNEVNNWSNRGTDLNLDYTKVPLHGYQCFLRIEMKPADPANGTEAKYCYMFIDPIRYAELADSGNINVHINYYFIEETHTSIITDIREVRTTDN